MMNDGIQNSAPEVWDKRWKGSEIRERITFLGRLIFAVKRRGIRKILNRITVNTMVEVGCGLGHTLSVYQEAGINSTGIDISRHAIAVCKAKGLNVNLRALEEISEDFELVSSDGLLEHSLDFEKQAEQLMRISLKYVLLIQPNHDSFPGKTLVYLSELIKKEGNVYEYNYRIKDFIKIFAKHGFQILENEPVFGNVFRLMLFAKRCY